MTEIATDERGRITIPKEIRERFGERYRMVELRNGVKLLAVPDDPVTALREASSEEFKQASMDELREAGLEKAQEEATGHVR
ncbi:AbrB/MazE/SpoVT family DNA-binding domain-containing protein [Natrarchaeobius sp. A-rgal3]|uniref:AbrB/MazE/SpoVT family DNA-binding domain-containing protein n=1 Tax=Natrarchaeobius versutus TaxID=1679078 RepID=UPI00350EAB29